MKEEEKQRKFHEALLKMLYPPPPSPPPRQEDEEEEEKKLIEPLNDLPEEELENEEGYSLPSSSDDNEGENGGTEKLTRAQRKRLRKSKLKVAASRRRKIIGPLLPGSSDDRNDGSVEVVGNVPLLPGSSDDRNDGSVEVVGNVPESVRQNAATDVSGEPTSCSKTNKLKQRRKSKKSAGEKLNSSSFESSTSNESQGLIMVTDDRPDP